MVRKVILIGFIGLLIALSNASNKKADSGDIENIACAAHVNEQKAFVLQKAWNTIEAKDATCPKDHKFYCKSPNPNTMLDPICIKGKDLAGKSVDQGSCQCEKAQNVIDVTPEEWRFMVETMKISNNLVTKEEFEKATEKESKQNYCYVLGHNHVASKGGQTKNPIAEDNLFIFFQIPETSVKIKQRRGLKMNEKVHYDLFTCGNPAEIKEAMEAYDYDQKPFYKKTQKMLLIFVLLAIAASACYWFLCCDKDDEDEEKDQNKAADP